MAEKLEAIQRGDLSRLIINMPPRHGKSELASRRFPAWCLGKDPHEKIIACSYNTDTAVSFNRDVQRIILSPDYKEVFPNTRLNERNVVTMTNTKYLRNASIFEIVNFEGYYRAAGVGGGITGQGSTLGFIDDPFKNHEEAYSETYRKRVWNWYTSTFLTRGEGAFSRGGDMRIVVTMTRWHDDDLCGRLIEQMKKEDGEHWEVVCFPAVLDDEAAPGDPRVQGQPLWPDKYDLRALKKLRKAVGPTDWNALYQQRPRDAAGGMFPSKWWRRYTPQNRPKMTYVWTSWDLAVKDLDNPKKKRSYNVGIVFGKNGSDFYVLDVVRFYGDFVKQIEAVKMLASKWPDAIAHVIEDKANGPAVISALRNRITGLLPWNPDDNELHPYEKKRGTSGKVSRAAARTPIVASGHVYLPTHAPWLQDFEDELSAFPTGTHDDQVDAFVQGLQYGDQSAISAYEQMGQAYG